MAAMGTLPKFSKPCRDGRFDQGAGQGHGLRRFCDRRGDGALDGDVRARCLSA